MYAQNMAGDMEHDEVLELYYAQSSEAYELIDAYHNSMNKFFNEKIKKLHGILKDENFHENPAFASPSGLTAVNYPENKDKCEGNVSTFCVGMEALDLYIEYVKALEYKREILPGGEYKSRPDLIAKWSQQNAELQGEDEIAEKTMLAAVAAYDEYRLAFPIHQKFETLIGSLIQYRIQLGKIRKEASEFPLRFVDATSDSCQ